MASVVDIDQDPHESETFVGSGYGTTGTDMRKFIIFDSYLKVI
jgi:hypothetical protein